MEGRSPWYADTVRILLTLVSLIALSLTVAMVFVTVWFAQTPEAPDGAALRAAIGALVFLLISVATGWVPARSLVALARRASDE